MERSFLNFYYFVNFITFHAGGSQSKLCNGVGYTSGRWIQRNTSISENFECCAAGQLHRHPWESPICKDPEVPIVGHHACDCLMHYYREHKHRKSHILAKAPANYEWVPTSCILVPWNESAFCDLIKDRKILMIGDSTMDQSHKSLQNMIYQGRDKNKKCAAQIAFELSDFIVEHPYERGKSLIQSLSDQNENLLYDIIIISTGPHYHSLVEYETLNRKVMPNSWEFMDMFGPKFTHAMVRLAELYRMSDLEYPTLIFKTENPAHEDCGLGPRYIMNNITKEQFGIFNEKSTYKWNYQFLIENRVIDLARQHNITIMRMDPLFGRADGHFLQDCMHYCAPGPLNIFARLFQHFMQVKADYWRKDDGVMYSFTQTSKHTDWKWLYNSTE